MSDIFGTWSMQFNRCYANKSIFCECIVCATRK